MGKFKPSPSKFVLCLLILVFLLGLAGCSSMEGIKEINENPDNIARGNPDNPKIAKEYLESVLESPEGREIKAYNRKVYSVDNKKSLFMKHSFYVFLKDNELEHTLVFTATPKGSQLDGTWMLDASSDVESYNLLVNSDNPWEMVEYENPDNDGGLDFEKTVKNILNRLEKNYSFFGPASVRDLPWYHLLWISAVPIPVISLASVLILSINNDNCNSAILETMAWK